MLKTLICIYPDPCQDHPHLPLLYHHHHHHQQQQPPPKHQPMGLSSISTTYPQIHPTTLLVPFTTTTTTTSLLQYRFLRDCLRQGAPCVRHGGAPTVWDGGCGDLRVEGTYKRQWVRFCMFFAVDRCLFNIIEHIMSLL